MDEHNATKKYESLKIPRRQQSSDGGGNQPLPKVNQNTHVSLSDNMFYEIEYDASPIPGVGKFVLKSQKIETPEQDEIRNMFAKMRDISRAYRSTYDFSRTRAFRVHHDSAAIFYKQAAFMKDFTDDYTDSAPFSQYFPQYQMMGYTQLRTYFTWRTAVRNGNVADTSLSYAFLYIYELLNNIGADDPQDGLCNLMAFWTAFRVYDDSIDKYVLRWLKDYHIYYDLPQPFHEFAVQHNLTAHYPGLAGADDSFSLFCAISKYDVRKSVFYTDDNAAIIADCFGFVIETLRRVFEDSGLNFDESIFQPTRNMSVWTPFKNALFYQWATQSDRRIVLSENEIYVCHQGKWTFSTAITTESGRQLIGYIMKQMESVLRKLLKHKHKLTANINTVMHPAVDKLRESGNSLETIVTNATREFYREATKTVVTVNPGTLSIIRRESIATQEKLVVPEQDANPAGDAPLRVPHAATPPDIPTGAPIVPGGQTQTGWSDGRQDAAPTESADSGVAGDAPLCVPPDHPATQTHPLRDVLTEIEINALSIVPDGGAALKQFADQCGVMLEVLVDGINEKAMDYIGDNLLDEDFALYDDYKELVKELIQ